MPCRKLTYRMNIRESKLYPLKFRPILKSMIWGGNDIAPFKQIETCQDNIGESWEISSVEGNISEVADGPLAGMPLNELLSRYKGKLIGNHNYERFGTTFPLLIKFIDAHSDLSIQVHPNDELAKKRHNSFGKTEMWYVIKASDDAKLYSGFKKQINPEEYVKTVADNTFTDTLQRYQVKSGDVFFLPAGRVHAIGAGCFVAEIQQTSNITYRIYDYNRKDANGNYRELHTELAKDAIDYRLQESYKTEYAPTPNHPVHLVSCPYFTTNLMELNKPINRDYSLLDSFVVYICMSGSALVHDDAGNVVSLKQGESLLLPAIIGATHIIPNAEQTTKILETYV